MFINKGIYKVAFYSDLNYIKPSAGQILEDVPDVYQAIYTLFGTKKGTRVFRPTYGANLGRYLFEPCDEITARSMMYDIMEAIKEEPRVTLNASASSVVPDPLNYRFIITLKFQINGFSDYEKTLQLEFNQRG